MSTTNENKLAGHILPTSATMVGVCLTGIGLVKIIERQIGNSYIDQFLAGDSTLFCISTLLSYGALRWAGKRRAERYERIADTFFTVGMVCMVVICVLFAFDLA